MSPIERDNKVFLASLFTFPPTADACHFFKTILKEMKIEGCRFPFTWKALPLLSQKNVNINPNKV